MRILFAGFVLSIICMSYGIQPTTDFTTHAHLIKIFNTSQEHLTAINNLNSRVQEIGNMLGDASYNNLVQYSSGIHKMVYDEIKHSSANDIVLGKFINNSINKNSLKNVPSIADVSGKLLFPKANEKNLLFLSDIDRVSENRRNLFLESCKTGFVLASLSQASIKNVQEILLEAEKRISSSKNLHDDMSTNNQISVIIANEVIQIRQILAKLLELNIAHELKYSEEWNKPLKKSAHKLNKSKYIKLNKRNLI
jgi:hypothetical protein